MNEKQSMEEKLNFISNVGKGMCVYDDTIDDLRKKGCKIIFLSEKVKK